MRTQSLLNEFVDLAKRQEIARRNYDDTLANELQEKLLVVTRGLDTMGDKGRAALLDLTNHPNHSVQFLAASASIAYDSEAAKTALIRLANANDFPFSVLSKIILTNRWGLKGTSPESIPEKQIL
jgi:hypothetical protein